jgi:hypothetical protein
MTQERWLVVVIATLVTDATWLFLLLEFLGFTAGIHSAPLSWPVVFGLPMLAALTHLLIRDRSHPSSKLGLLEPVVGIAVIYWAVSVGRIRDAVTAGFAWPLDFISGPLEARTMYSTAVVLLAAAFLWSRGIRRVNEPEPGTALLRSFRTGLAVFAGVVLFEAMGDLDLETRPMMLPFFAASLMGLAVSNSVGRFDTGTRWLGFAAASVAAVLATGLLVAILGSIVIRQGADILSSGWIAMMRVFVDRVSGFIEGLELEKSTWGSGQQSGGGGALIIEPPGSAGPDWSTVEIIVAVIEPLVIVAGTAAFVWLCRRLLAAQERSWPQAYLDLASVERESLGEQEALSYSRLFQRLLPGWMRRPAQSSARLPALGAGIDDVYVLYFRLLQAARWRGAAVRRSQTPFERAPELLAVLPGAPVEEITRRFVAACYGREPSSAAVIALLSGALEKAVRSTAHPDLTTY